MGDPAKRLPGRVSWRRVALVALALAFLVALDRMAALTADRWALADLTDNARATAELRAASLLSEIEKQRTLPLVLAEDPDVRSVLQPGGETRVPALNAKLEALAAGTRAGAIYLLDADGITSFRDFPDILFETYRGEPRLVLTPHEGEFHRLFPDIGEADELSKVEKAIAAAQRANAIIVYKGADTVVAAPDGRAVINETAPPWLATAGSGDVLAGMIGALLANGMPAFEAAAAGVYLHGEAARHAGDGLTAETLVRGIRPLEPA